MTNEEKAVKAAQAGLIVTPVAKIRRLVEKLVLLVVEVVTKNDLSTHHAVQPHQHAETRETTVKNQKQERKGDIITLF